MEAKDMCDPGTLKKNPMVISPIETGIINCDPKKCIDILSWLRCDFYSFLSPLPPQPCIGKMLRVLDRYISLVDMISTFESCSDLARKVMPVIQKLHSDTTTCVPGGWSDEKVRLVNWKKTQQFILNLKMFTDCSDSAGVPRCWQRCSSAVGEAVPVLLHLGPTLLLLHPHRARFCARWSRSTHKRSGSEMHVVPNSVFITERIEHPLIWS